MAAPIWCAFLAFPLLSGCKDAARAGTGEDAPAETRPGTAGPSPMAQDAAAPPTASDDPRGAPELADLAALCAAIDHDYIDGTLSDYYADVSPKTAWGTDTMKAGDEADQPGRHLEAAATELTKATGQTMPGSCSKFFGQLDDLE